MSVHPAFTQLLALAEKEHLTLIQYKCLSENGTLTSGLVGDFEKLLGDHNAILLGITGVVTGNAEYTDSYISEKIEKVGKMCGIGEATIDEYNLHESALYKYDTIVDKIKAMIEVLKPTQDYYHRMLATQLVRNYVENFDDYGAVPFKTYIPVEKLQAVADNINPEKLVFSSMVMDKATQKYREYADNLFIVYNTALKGLVYTLIALNGEYLEHDQINQIDKFLTRTNAGLIMLENFEFHGIQFTANKSNNTLELTLSPEMAEKVKEVKPYIFDYYHVFY